MMFFIEWVNESLCELNLVLFIIFFATIQPGENKCI